MLVSSKFRVIKTIRETISGVSKIHNCSGTYCICTLSHVCLKKCLPNEHVNVLFYGFCRDGFYLMLDMIRETGGYMASGQDRWAVLWSQDVTLIAGFRLTCGFKRCSMCEVSCVNQTEAFVCNTILCLMTAEFNNACN